MLKWNEIVLLFLLSVFAPYVFCPNRVLDVGTKLDLHILSVALQSFYINLKTFKISFGNPYHKTGFTKFIKLMCL